MTNREFVQTLQQLPRHLPLKRSHASFLADLIDPLPSSRPPKGYRPECVDSLVAHWIESTAGSESYRERQYLSDIPLGHSDAALSLVIFTTWGHLVIWISFQSGFE
jgi:hypothetical protein